MKPSERGATARTAAITAKLDAVEAEMRRLQWWDPNPPDLLAAFDEGRMRTYLDAPSFELWLQCVFLTRAREAVASQTLPGQSQVGLMALRQYDYHQQVPEARRLLELLNEFDALIERR